MDDAISVQQGSLFVRPKVGAGGRVYWDAQWRYRVADGAWSQKTRRLGLAWLERNGADGWRKRRGRCPEGWLDERGANVAAAAAMDEHAAELANREQDRVEAANRKVTVRELAFEWLEWLAEVRDAKPSTIADYRFLLREPGVPNKRGRGVSSGRIMAAFGDRPYDQVSTGDVSRFLRSLDKAGLTPRNVNKYRQVLAAIFQYACRADTYALGVNPAAGTDKRREASPAALDYYEVAEVEALAGAVARGAHRWVPRFLARVEESGLQAAIETTRVQPAAILVETEVNPFFAQRAADAGDLEEALAVTGSDLAGRGIVLDASELAARAADDRRDADAFRLLLYTGLRIGEVLTLRWEDVDVSGRMLLVRRGLSDGVETTPKGRRHRFVPLSTPAVETLARLQDRDEFTQPDDYVLCNRLGRRLDTSARRRRYKAGCAAAGLRPVRLHGLRHAAGSLIARTSDPVFVRDFLGHAKLTTTDRYLGAKVRPEEFERLDLAFGVAREEHEPGQPIARRRAAAT
jgi:integrase